LAAEGIVDFENMAASLIEERLVESLDLVAANELDELIQEAYTSPVLIQFDHQKHTDCEGCRHV
jgi:uncharacterized protein with von Willebrand factor type A (vWA) domain